MIGNGKVYGIAYADLRKQSTSWLKGVKKVLAKSREAGHAVPDFEFIWKEITEELERRLSTGKTTESQVATLEPEKMREGR
jgi:hypothetical protein